MEVNLSERQVEIIRESITDFLDEVEFDHPDEIEINDLWKKLGAPYVAQK